MDGNAKITPFWNRIPKFFLYGLHPHILILAAALAGANYLIGGPLVDLVLYVVAIKYAAEILKHTAEGELRPPRITVETINENLELPFKLFVVFLCYFYLIAHFIDSVSPLLALPIYIISLLLLPAVVISLIITEEIGYALNPLNWINIPLRIGWPYLVMVVFLFLLDSIHYTFSDLVGSKLSRNLIEPFWLAVYTYFMAVIFHLMGYVVMQYHEELGAEAPAGATTDRDNKADDAHTTPLLRRFIEEGNVPAAIAEFSSLLEANPEDLELRRKIYVYLRSNGQNDYLKRYVPQYSSLLMRNKRYTEAATLFIEAHERSEPCYPTLADDYLPLMVELRRRRASKQAVLLAQGFHKRFPEDANTPGLYLEMAKVLSEELQRDDLATQALQYLLRHFPEHPLLPQVKQYLALLSQMQGSPAIS